LVAAAEAVIIDQILPDGLGVATGFSDGEPGVTSATEMAGFAVSLLGRPRFFTATPASRRYRAAVSR